MKGISREQIKAIYALGNALGLVCKDDAPDLLHQLAERVTGKSSISSLTALDGIRLIDELKDLMRSKNRATEQQKKKVWAVYYSLKGYDSAHSTVSDGERLAGVIKKVLGISVSSHYPLANITKSDAAKLIKTLECYIDSVRKRGAANGQRN